MRTRQRKIGLERQQTTLYKRGLDCTQKNSLQDLYTTTIQESITNLILSTPTSIPTSLAGAKKMQVSCFSDEYYMKATVYKAAITNLSKPPKAYSPSDYTTIPYVEFRPATTVFFLTGRIWKEASKEAFQSMCTSTKKPKGAQLMDKKQDSVKSAPLFKVANWVVQLYDHSIYIHCLYFHLFILLN